MIIKLVCTRKYFIDDKRGWKLFFTVPDGAGYEANGDIVIITKDDALKNRKQGDSIEANVDVILGT
jgi:hypothetical protein